MHNYLIAITMLAFVLFWQTNEAQAQTFQDVTEDEYYYEAVEQLVERGIINKSNYFQPENELTRGQMAKMIALALGLETKKVNDPKYKDVPKEHQFYPYIAALENAGIINGYSDGTYGVNKKVTRAHMAKFIVNSFEFERSEAPYFELGDVKIGTEVYQNAATLYFHEVLEVPYIYRPNEYIQRFEAAHIIASSINEKTYTKIRISFDDLGFSMFQNDGEYRSFVVHKPELLVSRIDALNHELVLYVFEEGQTGISEESGEIPAIQLDVDKNLHVTYELKNQFDSQYKAQQPLYFYSDENQQIRALYLEQMSGNEKGKYLLTEEVEEDEYYEYVDIYPERPNEIFKIIIEYTDGKTAESYVQSKENETSLYLVELIIATENKVKIVEPKHLLGYTLAEGNESAVGIFNNKTPDYIEIAEPGTYTFNVAYSESELVKAIVEVFELDGKMMYYVTYE